ncbi:MAG: hypothetical protein HY901_27215 [Deltaproteobacteria bacterium]|nr:hypothetical protein [Deltaproteobacteria bacterium]
MDCVEPARFGARIQTVADLDPAWVLSAHLPPARRMAGALCRNLAGAPDAPGFVAPDQAAFEAILREAGGHEALSPAPGT